MNYLNKFHLNFILFGTLILNWVVLANCFIFDLKINETLNKNTSYDDLIVSTSCKCMQLCWTKSECVAYRADPRSDRWRCYLFEYGPTHHLINSTGLQGQCGVKQYPGSSLEADGLYYFIPAKPSLNFPNARNDCKVAPWYRLALLKTFRSYNMALSKYVTGSPWTVVDLEQNAINDRNATFGDGTPFGTSQVSKSGVTLIYNNFYVLRTIRAIFVLINGFNDEDPNTEHNPLCQGNPLGLIF